MNNIVNIYTQEILYNYHNNWTYTVQCKALYCSKYILSIHKNNTKDMSEFYW